MVILYLIQLDDALVDRSPEESSLGNRSFHSQSQKKSELNVSSIISAELLQRSPLLYVLAVVGCEFSFLHKLALWNQELRVLELPVNL